MAVKKRDTTGGFLPNIHLGEDIGRPAIDCIRWDGVFETRLLSPQLHQVLLGMARLRNAVSSFRLEGETVDLDRARQILDGAKPESPSEIGVHRLANAYREVSRGKGPSLTVQGLLDTHRTLFKDLIRPDWIGVLKPEQNTIINVNNGSARFVPTPPERTEQELTRLFEWLRRCRYTLPAPVISAIFFAEFEAIHPFMDGNGRLGRLLNIAVLVSLGLRKAALIPLDTRFFRTSDHYYEYLGTTNTPVRTIITGPDTTSVKCRKPTRPLRCRLTADRLCRGSPGRAREPSFAGYLENGCLVFTERFPEQQRVQPTSGLVGPQRTQ